MGAPQGHQRSDSTCSLVSLTTPLGKNVASVMLVGLVGAFDFTASLMSIQPYYYFLKGPERLYGVTFGCYDIFQILAVPIFARFVDRTGRFRNCFVFGILRECQCKVLSSRLLLSSSSSNCNSSHTNKSFTPREKSQTLETYCMHPSS